MVMIYSLCLTLPWWSTSRKNETKFFWSTEAALSLALLNDNKQ